MSNLRPFISILALVALASCATTGGNSFDRDKAVSFTVGKTSKSEVIAALGKPWREEVYTAKKDGAGKDLAQPAVLSQVRYYHYQRDAAAKPAEAQAARNAVYTFSANTLVSYVVISTFAEDATDFDEERASRIIKGQTSREDVIALMGPPAGWGAYPVAQAADGRSMTYEVLLSLPKTSQRTLKTLRIYLDRQDIVTDYELDVRNR